MIHYPEFCASFEDVSSYETAVRDKKHELEQKIVELRKLTAERDCKPDINVTWFRILECRPPAAKIEYLRLRGDDFEGWGSGWLDLQEVFEALDLGDDLEGTFSKCKADYRVWLEQFE